jgi:hypothetical protein
MFAAAVVLSVAGLFVGPVLVTWTRGTRTAFAALDGAILGIVPTLLLLRLLPHLVEETGLWAVGACLVGFLGYTALESRAHGRATDFGLAIVLPTLAIHGFLDGAGLALVFQRGDLLSTGAAAIGAALVMHKVPEGLFVASVLLPSLGPRRTWMRIAALAFATVLGALSGRELLSHTPDQVLHVVVALGLGVMLRMVIHRHGSAPATGTERTASGIAFVACLAALLALPDPQRLFTRSQPGELTALQTLAPLLLETAPWLLLALAVAEGAAWRRRDDADHEDGPTMMWLPMVALSLPLLGAVFALLRALIEPLCATPDLRARMALSMEMPWRDRTLSLVARAAPRAGRVLPSYAVGVGVAIAIEAALPRGVFKGIGWEALPLAAVLAIVARIGAAGTTVLAALFVHKGLPLPAAVVFTGVGAYLFSLGRSARPLRESVPALFALGLAMLVTAVPGFVGTPRLHQLAAHRHPWGEWLAAIALAAWILAQLMSSGPRAWFAALRPPQAVHQHD